MTTLEKQIWLDYGSIGFDTPDQSTFKLIQKTFAPFFASAKFALKDDAIKSILSSKKWILGVLERNQETHCKCMLKPEYDQPEIHEYLNEKFFQRYQKNLVFLSFERNKFPTA